MKKQTFNPTAPDRVTDGQWAAFYGIARGTANDWRHRGAPLDRPEEIPAWLRAQDHPPETLARAIEKRMPEIIQGFLDSPAITEDYHQRAARFALWDLNELLNELSGWREGSPEVARLETAIEELQAALRACGWQG